MSRHKIKAPSFMEIFGGSEQEPEAESALPAREAQRDFLTQLVARTARNLTPFQRGEFVRYLEGAGPLKKFARDGMVLMFWRYLDMENASDINRLNNINETERTMVPDTDCMVAVFLGDQLQFNLSSSILLEREIV